MTLLDNTITGKTSSSHCGPLKLQIQIAKKRSKNTVKKLKIKNDKSEIEGEIYISNNRYQEPVYCKYLIILCTSCADFRQERMRYNMVS